MASKHQIKCCNELETAKKVEKHPVYEKQILWLDQSHTKICFWMRAKFVENSFRVLISFLTRKQLRRPMCLYYEKQSIFLQVICIYNVIVKNIYLVLKVGCSYSFQNYHIFFIILVSWKIVDT